MASVQLASFFFEVAPSSPRSPKVTFSAVAPWRRTSSSARRAARALTLDTIFEEDGSESTPAKGRGKEASSRMALVLPSRLRALTARCVSSHPFPSRLLFLVVLAWCSKALYM
ncbi:hypothetical protein BHE74_00055167 [Ensete ventricosum]|nr:hypothetical protein BHE74_00055167 [Ensete ventricosum]RZS26416.1 hypothetical protein BHM03_00059758 [Ensete ventricosum]